ncbi:hypothetical protein [Niallia taxi]|uniref:hypothetical protein n=1 Tax=Niallia taxi TaxID=2499688 RepID=UPI0021A268FE|nr:hypothetical protein [Niallia taxi]MCT2343404.1 hypothetical protein [Niallia taxi]MDE5053109.1 hypothetical protein [Niallia taxi]WOD61506.1 hypothetical protein NQZ71_11785 [Niallia taxi]
MQFGPFQPYMPWGQGQQSYNPYGNWQQSPHSNPYGGWQGYQQPSFDNWNHNYHDHDHYPFGGYQQPYQHQNWQDPHNAFQQNYWKKGHHHPNGHWDEWHKQYPQGR